MFIYILCFILFVVVQFSRLLRAKRAGNVVAFFHPYCNAGGGGERVLWCAIRCLQNRHPHLRFVVFSGDCDATKEQILLKAKQRFAIELDPNTVEFVFLKWRRIVEADLYPHFTLLAQTLAGAVLSLEALCRLTPAMMIDSMGYPLSLPVFRWLGGCTTLAYVHYPTISMDMVSVVERRESSYNNSSSIAGSAWKSLAKLVYYRLFSLLYRIAGSAAQTVMANGSWTRGHLSQLWGERNLSIVYPPCDVAAFTSIDNKDEQILSQSNRVQLLSIGQIRPEKNHRLQLEVLQRVREKLNEDGKGVEVELCIAGGCRNEQDEERVRQLKAYAKELRVSNAVKWKLNVPFDELLELLSESMISLHTMWNEHFGIGVVEGMAAGTVMIAHKSGGPLMDIVVPLDGAPTGFLAETAEEYCSAVMSIVWLSVWERSAVRSAARRQSTLFGEAAFEQSFHAAVHAFLPSTLPH